MSGNVDFVASPAVEATLLSSSALFLHHFCEDTALFYAQQAHAYHPCASTAHQLALVHFRRGDLTRAAAILHPYSASKNAPPAVKYLRAVLAFRSGDYNTAEANLTGGIPPHGAFGYYLLGRVCEATQRQSSAIQAYSSALKLQPLFLDAYVRMSRLAMQTQLPDALDIFASSSSKIKGVIASLQDLPSVGSSEFQRVVEQEVETGDVEMVQEVQMEDGNSEVLLENTPISEVLDSSVECTPKLPPSSGASSGGSGDDSTSHAFSPPRPSKAARERRRMRRNVRPDIVCGRLFSGSPGVSPALDNTPPPHPPPHLQSHRSVHISVPSFNTPVHDSVRSPSSWLVGVNEVSSDAVGYVLKMEEKVALGFQRMSEFRCREAVVAWMSLPEVHRTSPSVQCLVGSAYFECAEYEEATASFGAALNGVRALRPLPVEGLDMYSTLLWHLRRERELVSLCSKLGETAPSAAETYVANGNAFSLRGDHQRALSCFRLATEAHPTYVYANTLCGHEHIARDELDEAEACFRRAIRMDGRHYNAWYGLGMVYERKELREKAEYYFRRALVINERSPVLRCFLGHVLCERGLLRDAQMYLEEAVQLQPKNLLAKIYLSDVLEKKKDYSRALSELESVRQLAPRESAVYERIGRIMMETGDMNEALRAYRSAVDLDPKDSSRLQKQIEEIEQEI